MIENKSDAFSTMVNPNTAAMQPQHLPSDILRDILSRLSIKDVVRMSILSREWRRLRIYHPDLVFTKDTFSNSTTENTEHLEQMTFYEQMEIKLEWLTRRFIKNVDSVLRPLWYRSTSTTAITTTTLDKFAIKFGLRKKHKYHIDRWVSFSTSSKATDIALDFMSEEIGYGPEYDKYKYALPLSNLSGPNGSCVRSLYLGYVHIELPPSFCGITNLKKLTLNMVSINEDDLRCLLLSCARLENLSLEWCKSLSSLRIRQELCRLQDLRVRWCDLEVIELHASNLKTFEFDDCVKKIVLGECMKLSEATLVSNKRAGDFDEYGVNFTFTELPTALPHVHKLFLLLNVDQVLRFSENQSRFTNLWHLNMNLGIFFDPPDTSWAVRLVNLLELTPFLETLELHLGRDSFCPSAMRTATAMQGPVHRHLKSVYMSGFCDVLGLAELALYILGNANALKRMVVDPAAYIDPWYEDIYSVSKGGSTEECPHINQKRIFAEKNLDREEFRHIVTIL